MVTVSMRADLQELDEFLGEGGPYLRGHPEDKDVLALRAAMQKAFASPATTATVAALADVKTAFTEGSWFMQVLREHAGDAEFERATELCVRTSDGLFLVTGDCPAPVYSSTGRWEDLPPVPMGAPDTNPMWKELNHYSEIECYLSHYTYLLGTRMPMVLADRRLPSTCQVEVDELKKLKAEFPTSQHQLRMLFRPRPQGMFLYAYHSSYVEFSSTNKWSRSWLLASLPALLAQLEQCHRTCTFPVAESLRAEADRLYGQIKSSYAAWEALAAAAVQAAFRAAQLRGREETGGRPRGPSQQQQSAVASMRAQRVEDLLHELRVCLSV